MRTLTPILWANMSERVRMTRYADSATDSFELRSAQFNLFPAGTEQKIAWHDPLDLAVVGIDEQYFRDLLERALESSSFELVPAFAADNPLLISLLIRLSEEIRQPGPLSVLKGQALTDLFLLQLAESHSTLSKQLVAPGNADRKRFSEVVEYIENNLTKTLTLQEIADVAGLSSFHFLRQFKRTFQLTPHDYVLQRRIERSKLLLQCGRYSIQEIAVAVGFVDPGHFSKAFKQRAGISPSQYRRTYC
jgi:AraC family transcriptional regulator